MRYRNGYDKPLAWMEPGKVYKVTFQPMQTSDYFLQATRYESKSRAVIFRALIET